jgi:hypothetical protein
MLPVPYEPPQRYDSNTLTVVPVFVPFLRAGVVMALEWTTLAYIENAPVSVRWATFILALLIFAVLESRDWLNFKGRWHFPVSVIGLLTVYCAVVAYAYFNQPTRLPTPPPQATQASPAVVQAQPQNNSGTIQTMWQMGPINTENMIGGTEEVMKRLAAADNQGILVTSAPQNADFGNELANLFNAGLYRLFSLPEYKGVNTKRLVLSLPDYSVYIDAPRLPASDASGIIVHGDGPIEDLIQHALSRCFVVRRASKVPSAFADYLKRNVVWIEVGNGPLWRAPEGREHSACGE